MNLECLYWVEEVIFLGLFVSGVFWNDFLEAKRAMTLPGGKILGPRGGERGGVNHPP